jgi:hypothetical protein
MGVERFDGNLSFDQVLAEADAKMYAEKKISASARRP